MMLAVSEPCDEKRVMAPSSKESVALPSGGEPVQAEVEYVLSEDLKDLNDVDCHLQVSVLAHRASERGRERGLVSWCEVPSSVSDEKVGRIRTRSE